MDFCRFFFFFRDIPQVIPFLLCCSNLFSKVSIKDYFGKHCLAEVTSQTRVYHFFGALRCRNLCIKGLGVRFIILRFIIIYFTCPVFRLAMFARE